MRIFVFGIDGLSMRIIQPLMDKGLMPNFKSIHDSGNRGVLKSTVPPFTPSGWASIYTGKNPGKHRLFEFSRIEGHEFVTNTCWDYNEAPPFWKYLSENGKKCILLNMPMYYPPLKLNNCHSVSGFNAVESFNIFHPGSLKEEFQKKIPDYRIESSWRLDLPEDQKKEYIKDNIEVTRSRIKALNYLMKEKSWDLFFSVFTVNDRMQHFFWDEIINGDPQVVEYYSLLDRTVGEVLAYLSEEDFFIVLSDHGFCRIEKGVNINKVLELNGFLSIKRNVKLPVNYGKISKKLKQWGVRDSLKKILPRKLINKVQQHSKFDATFSFSKVDWENTKSFAPSALYGGVNINLKGRELNGIVTEAEYETVRDEVIKCLLSLKDDGNPDKKVIKKIYKREEIYSGRFLEEMPDLILIAETGYRFDGSLESGSVFMEPRSGLNNEIMMCGEHEIDTLFMFHHGSFKKGFKEVSVNDIAPSVLNLFDVPIPTTMDGKSLFEEYKAPRYIDELTHTVFEKKRSKSSLVADKIKNL